MKLKNIATNAIIPRQAEMAHMLRVSKTGGMLHLHGPGGIGKTTLLNEFCANIAARRYDARDLSRVALERVLRRNSRQNIRSSKPLAWPWACLRCMFKRSIILFTELGYAAAAVTACLCRATTTDWLQLLRLEMHRTGSSSRATTTSWRIQPSESVARQATRIARQMEMDETELPLAAQSASI
jgi:GTPase SAR1 family protein